MATAPRLRKPKITSIIGESRAFQCNISFLEALQITTHWSEARQPGEPSLNFIERSSPSLTFLSFGTIQEEETIIEVLRWLPILEDSDYSTHRSPSASSECLWWTTSREAEPRYFVRNCIRYTFEVHTLRFWWNFVQILEFNADLKIFFI